MFFSSVKRDLLHHLSGSHYERKIKLNLLNVFRAFLSVEFQAVFYYRVYNYTSRKKLNLITFLFYQYAKHHFGIDIAPKARISPGLRIAHCSDIVIGPNVEIGNDTVIFNGVTLGKKTPGGKGGMPKVGKSVTLGTGAKLLGGIQIGDYAKIGANSVVLTDVPEYKTAVGVPATIK